MYDELVKRLRELASIPEHCENVADCDQCSKEDICLSFTNKRIIETATKAADAIEELMRFAYFVAREVVVTDEEWELNNLAFPEIICRKLNNLGVVSKAGEMWHYEPPEEEPTCKDCQRECQMIGLDMEACASYEPPKEETK